jgi:drug/metabolite transporter (DMT)-like permease
MLPALLAAFFFACSAIFSQRAARIFGSLPAHFFRLCGACLVLGVVCQMAAPLQVSRPVLQLFLLSGVVGFGLGDAFLFAAYPRLGSRVALLIQFCVSALTGALGDWIWLGRGTPPQAAAAATLILAGMAATLLAKGNTVQRRGSFSIGLLLGLGSAVCMGMGTVISNQAIHQAAAESLPVPALTQAWLRVSAGVVMAGLIWLGQLRFFPVTADSPARLNPSFPMKAFWLIGTSLMGPVFGITCYQWALGELGSSAIVLAVAATSAIFILPLARLIERDKPQLLEVGGTLLAVAGIVWLRYQQR